MNNFLDFLKKYWWLALFFVLFPYFVAFIYYFPFIPPDLGLTYKEWLNFWGVFIGSAIGGLTALYAVYSSLKQNDRFHSEQIKYQEEQDRKRKRDVKPILNLSLIIDPLKERDFIQVHCLFFENLDTINFFNLNLGKSIEKKTNIYYSCIDIDNTKFVDQNNCIIHLFEFENIGASAALNFEIQNNNKRFSPYMLIGKDKKTQIAFIFPFTFSGENDFNITFKYQDIYDNSYIQKSTMKFSRLLVNNHYQFLFNHSPISPPEEIK